MKTETIVYTVAREGHAKTFDNRITAKVVYRQWKEEYPETVLRKTIVTVQTLEFDDKSECWL